jgi:hypothetical protein
MKFEKYKKTNPDWVGTNHEVILEKAAEKIRERWFPVIVGLGRLKERHPRRGYIVR